LKKGNRRKKKFLEGVVDQVIYNIIYVHISIEINKKLNSCILKNNKDCWSNADWLKRNISFTKAFSSFS